MVDTVHRTSREIVPIWDAQNIFIKIFPNRRFLLYYNIFIMVPVFLFSFRLHFIKRRWNIYLKTRNRIDWRLLCVSTIAAEDLYDSARGGWVFVPGIWVRNCKTVMPPRLQIIYIYINILWPFSWLSLLVFDDVQVFKTDKYFQYSMYGPAMGKKTRNIYFGSYFALHILKLILVRCSFVFALSFYRKIDWGIQ